MLCAKFDGNLLTTFQVIVKTKTQVDLVFWDTQISVIFDILRQQL